MNDDQLKKIHAGTLLSKFVKEIANESTEMVIGPDGEGRMATKAEALARYMWKAALGYHTVDVKTGKETFYKPDKTFIGMVWDRVEGRVVSVAEKDKNQKATLADRVSDQVKRRLNILATENPGAVE